MRDGAFRITQPTPENEGQDCMGKAGMDSFPLPYEAKSYVVYLRST